MQISAKTLGDLKSHNFCQRCFWVKTHQKQLPYQIFPGIFNSIDSYTKSIVMDYVSREGKLPDWLKDIGEVNRAYKNAADAMKGKNIKSKAKFNVQYKDVLLTGIPDAIYQRPNRDIVIVDYKTARYTSGQDDLLPVYEIQLNGYAYIAEKLGIKPVESLYSIYFEPPERESHEVIAKRYTTAEGFEMPFKPVVHRIRKDTKEIETLMDKAYGIYALTNPPKGRKECKDCKNVANLSNLLYSRK